MEEPVTDITPVATEVHTETEEYIIKGKTIFGEPITWGVSQEAIEGTLGAPMPDPAIKIKGYAAPTVWISKLSNPPCKPK